MAVSLFKGAQSRERPFFSDVQQVNPFRWFNQTERCKHVIEAHFSFRHGENRRRWAHVFPPFTTPAEPYGSLWRSLCMPACLPLITDYLPSESALRCLSLTRS